MDIIIEYNCHELEKSELLWNQRFKSHMEDLLKKIINRIPKDNFIMKELSESKFNMFFEKEQMKIWRLAFTHKSLSLTDNFENLEYLGDRILKSVFIKWLLHKNPIFTSGELNSLDEKYMSKIKQRELVIKIGLKQFVRSIIPNIYSENFLEDIFESFTGAFFENTQSILGTDAGNVIIYYFIDYIMDGINILKSSNTLNSKSQVIQLFSKLTNEKSDKNLLIFKTTEKLDTGIGNKVTVKINLNKFQREITENYLRYKLKSPTIGIGIGKTLVEAEMKAYDNALKYLNSLGINEMWSKKQKEIIVFSDPKLKVYYPKLLEKMKKEDIYVITFGVPNVGEESNMYLEGIKLDGTKIILSTVKITKKENSYEETKIKLIKLFLNI